MKFDNKCEEEPYKHTQMDLDALESLRTGREGYDQDGEKVKIRAIDTADYNFSYKCVQHRCWCKTFSFKKPVEVPPKGTIVEVRLAEAWFVKYSCGDIHDGELVCANRKDLRFGCSFKTWRIPE